MEYTLIPSHLLLLFITVITISTRTQLIMSNPSQDIVCAAIPCGQGACKASNASILGFECECYPGWKKVQIGPFVFPPCVLPNCTIDFQCGKGSGAPSPPPLLPPPPNFTNPCGLVWCGDGTCATTATGYTCQCSEGSENFMDLNTLPCFKQCSLGADCKGLKLTSPPPSPPQSDSSGSQRIGSIGLPNRLRTLRAVTTIFLVVIF